MSLKYDLSKIFVKGKYEDSQFDIKVVEKLVDWEMAELMKELGQVKAARLHVFASSVVLMLIYWN